MVLLNFIASLVLKILHNLFASLEINDEVNKITKRVQSDLTLIAIELSETANSFVYIYVCIYIYINLYNIYINLYNIYINLYDVL